MSYVTPCVGTTVGHAARVRGKKDSMRTSRKEKGQDTTTQVKYDVDGGMPHDESRPMTAN